MAVTLYATVADLQSVLSGTDGTGTAAQLTPAQLTLALESASSRVSIYAGNTFDSSSPSALPPPAFHDLTLDLAAFYATAYYMKSKIIGVDHPVRIKYADAMQLLKDVRDGKVRLDPAIPGSVGDEIGVVINRIPNIFTEQNAGVRVNQQTTTLEAETSSYGAGWTRLDETGPMGPEYQG
jgi:phage gp36-like protein